MLLISESCVQSIVYDNIFLHKAFVTDTDVIEQLYDGKALAHFEAVNRIKYWTDFVEFVNEPQMVDFHADDKYIS